MRNNNYSITNCLISEEDVRRKLPSIFTDSIILDANFNIVVVSKNVLDLLDFRSNELHQKTINYISGTFDFQSFLNEALLSGFFQEKYIEFFSKNNRPVLTIVSGFYLGLISDINGYIILRLKEADEFQKVNREIEAQRLELDNFIYRAAHDLRGPLATMRGLINLYKLKKDEFVVDHLMHLIDHQASELDEKLFNLVYLAKADRFVNRIVHTFNTNQLQSQLRDMIASKGFSDFLDFQFHTDVEEIEGINEELFTSMLVNVLDFILNLPATDNGDPCIIFFISLENWMIEIKVVVRGFLLNEHSYNAIQTTNCFYGDMLTNPELVNYFAAMKIALRLKASMHMNVNTHSEYEICFSIPMSSKPPE
jgi:signal transduction histidine kinase